MHVLTTVISTILIVFMLYIGINPSSYIIDRHELVGNTIQILTLVFVVEQLIYLANVGLGIWKSRKAS
jgi:hypothetical protein